MTETQLLIQGMPYVAFAHRYDTFPYRIERDPVTDIVEFVYILQGDCTLERFQPDGSLMDRVYVPTDSVFCNIYNCPHLFTSPHFHQHTTVGVHMTYTTVSQGGLVLPQVLSFESGKNPVRQLIEELVLNHHMESSPTLQLALVWELLGTISHLYLSDKQKEQSFGQAWYVNKAKKYILDNLASPLTIADIAAQLDISPGYLSHLFSALQGQTVVEYINTLRMRRVEELVLVYGLDIRQAGAQVGLRDPNYVSRLFRRYRGCTLSELRHARFTKKNMP